MRAALVALLWLPLSQLGCSIEADYAGTSFACAESATCPSGFTCSGGVCRPEGAADAGQGCDGGMEELSSAFSADALWETATEGGAEVQVGGDEVVFTLPAQAASAGAIRTRCAYDLTGTRISLELVSPPQSGRARFEAGPIGGEERLAFEIDDGRLLMVFERDGDRQQGSIGFDAENHRRLAISEQGGYVVFETAPRGGSWSPQRSHEVPAFVGEIVLTLSAEADDPAAAEAIQFQGLRGEPIDG